MKKSLLITSLAIMVGSSLLSSCSGDSSTEGVQNQANSEEYYCPMKCEGNKTYAKPGKCPECGMKLVE